MRYFLFTFDYLTPTKHGTYDFSFYCEKFPNKKAIRKSCADFHGVDPDDLMIINMFEFKSFDDYESFTSKS